jgi:hypothetical protein
MLATAAKPRAVRSLLLQLALAVALLAGIDTSTIAAQTATSPGWQTVTTQGGTQFQVPADWTVAMPESNTLGTGSVIYASPDRITRVTAFDTPLAPFGGPGPWLQGVVERDDEQSYINYAASPMRPLALNNLTAGIGYEATGINPYSSVPTNIYEEAGVSGGTIHELGILTYSYMDAANPSLVQTILGSLSATSAPHSTTSNSAPVSSPTTASIGVGDGSYIVGSAIQPGTYVSDGGADCYWARLRTTNIADNQIIYSAYAPHGSLVTIQPTDVAFYSQGCGHWIG